MKPTRIQWKVVRVFFRGSFFFWSCFTMILGITKLKPSDRPILERIWLKTFTSILIAEGDAVGSSNDIDGIKYTD